MSFDTGTCQRRRETGAGEPNVVENQLDRDNMKIEASSLLQQGSSGSYTKLNSWREMASRPRATEKPREGLIVN